VSTQPPEGEPGSDPASPGAPPPGPGPDADTARMPWEPTAAPPPPPGSTGPSVLWAAPTTPTRAEILGAPGLAFADTTSRFIAYIIDGVLVSIVGTIIATVLGLGRTTVVQSGNTTGAYFSVAGAAFAVPWVIVGFVYFVFFWTGGRRATPGQQLFKLQVGNAFDGKPLTLTQATKRWLALGTFLSLFAVLPSIYPLASLVELVWIVALLVTTVRSPTKQGFHDRFANTAVVRPATESSSSLATTCLIIAAIVIGLLFASVIGLIFLGSQLSEILSRAGESV
jgi:uncharacterized RDD family membrane protein YckC